MTELNLIGTTLGRFEILSELGRGGMAVVYKAGQTDLDRIVALKVLPPALTHDASYVARFKQEARSVARLEHPHIMPIYEVGEAGGLHYIAMKYIQGQTVKDLVQAEGALTVQRSATILAQVGDALDYAHRQGVIHRDIKPSNMMVTEEGWVYLTDFGLARGSGASTAGLTMAGTVMGTPEYMSPEQAQGLPNVGPPTDIYALGVVLYELLTGTFPFKADTPMGMLAARLLQAPIPPRDVRGDLPPAVEDVVMRALARKPEARYPTAAAMVAALRAAAGIGSAEPPRPATPVAGLPALGDTIRVPAPPPPSPTPATGGAPYVQGPPLDVTQPVAMTPPTPTPQPHPGPTPHTPGGLNVDGFTLPAPGPQTPAPAKRHGPRTMTVILGALGVVALACIGLFASMALIDGGDPISPGDTMRTAVADGDLNVALADADEPLAEDDGLPEALAAYGALLDEHPNNPRVLARLAMAHSAAGDWLKAEEFANKLIDTPESDDGQVALGYALLADAYASRGDLTAALGEIDKAIENDRGLALGHAVESNLLAARARAAGDTAEMEQALVSLDRAVDAIADDEPLAQALARNALAYTFSQEHQLSGDEDYFRQSEEQYRAAIELLPASGLFRSNLGYLLLSEGDYGGARDSFEEALDSGYLPAQAGLGWVHWSEDELDEAEEAFDEAIAAAPNDPEGYFGKGRLRYAEDDFKGAIELLAQAVERNPRSPELQGWLGEALFWKGFNGENGAGDEAFAQAADAYNAAIASDERNVFAISGLAWTLQHQELYDESVATFDRALALDPHNATLYNGKGWSLFNQGSYADAEAAFRQALERDGEFPEAHYNLGRALEEQGRADEARAAYEQALALNPDYVAAQERLDALGE